MATLTQTIEQAYGFKILRLTTIKTLKNSSYVGKILTSDGKMYAVKSLFINKDRQQFIVQTERLLSERGVKLAAPVLSRENQLFFEYQDVPYVVYEWVIGKNQRLNNRHDLESVARALGKFHRLSVGLSYPQGTKIFAHHHWIKDYKDRLKTMKERQEKYRHSKGLMHRFIAKNLPFFQNMGKVALKKLKASPYPVIISKPFREQSLVHGDFHQKNIITQGEQKILIDFEDIRYDLPSKDLTRIYEMYMRKHLFNKKDFSGMLKKYEAANPHSKKVKQVVRIDFLFPHIFERNLRQNKYEKMPLSKAIQQIEQERKKIKFIYQHYFKNK